jgi:predicted CXXCH cytochrome family protein
MILYERRDWIAGVTKEAKVETVKITVIDKQTGDVIENEDVDVEENGYFVYPVVFANGINVIRVKDHVIYVYFPESDDAIPPENFKEYRIHQSVPDLCQECHDIFQESRKDFLLNEDYQITICENCHKPLLHNRLRKAYAYIHNPLRSGECSLCHNTHLSAEEHMLNVPVKELCFECHNKFIGKSKSAKFVHLGEKFDESCVKCHNPHSSNLKHLIRDSRKGVCASCHEETAGKKSGVDYKSIHKPVVQKKCYLCHEMHKGADEKFLIKKDKKAICKECHAEKLTLGHGDLIKECLKCHDSHVSKKTGLFTERGIIECLMCHKDLKYLEKVPQKRDCQSCHNPHSSRTLDVAGSSCKNCHESADLTKNHSDVPPAPASCLNCHLIHGDLKKGLLKPNIHPVDSEKICKGCHVSKDINSAIISCLDCHRGEYDIKHPLTIINEAGCVNCHKVHGDGVKKLLEKVQHQPFIENKCEDCHKNIDESLVLTEKAESGELCIECHEDVGMDINNQPFKVLHRPFNEMECIKCHKIHSSQNELLLRQVGTDLCYKCHKNLELDENDLKLSSVHQPVSEGECSECHDPHGSNYESVLFYNDVELLCFGNCHKNFLQKGAPTPMKKSLQAKKMEELGKMIAGTAKKRKAVAVKKERVKRPMYMIIHKPITEEGCTPCHDPHSSKNNKLIVSTKDDKFLCYNCHKDYTLDEQKEKISFIHDPVLKEECFKCHEIHANDNKYLLKKALHMLCNNCHPKLEKEHHVIEKAVLEKKGSESPLESMRTIPESFIIKGKNLLCINCHVPHSSQEEFLLKNKKALCTLCHAIVPS